MVASHLHAHMSEDEFTQLRGRVDRTTRAASGPRGFGYTFTKLQAIARRPERQAEKSAASRAA